MVSVFHHTSANAVTLFIVLKGIIGYSDYSLEMEIFECFQANRIFVCYFKASHLCTLAVC